MVLSVDIPTYPKLSIFPPPSDILPKLSCYFGDPESKELSKTMDIDITEFLFYPIGLALIALLLGLLLNELTPLTLNLKFGLSSSNGL